MRLKVVQAVGTSGRAVTRIVDAATGEPVEGAAMVHMTPGVEGLPRLIVSVEWGDYDVEAGGVTLARNLTAGVTGADPEPPARFAPPCRHPLF